MSIKSIRLRNFRGFSDATLELKPLTVLVGPNSSGNSSFSHPLAAMSHCQQFYQARRDASLTPRTVEESEIWPVDLGGYHDLATSGATDRVYIDIETGEGWVELGFGLVPHAPDLLLLSYIALPQNVNITSIGDYTTTGSDNTRLVVPQGHSVSELEIPRTSSIEETRLVLQRINEQQWQHEGQQALVGLNGLIPVSVIHSTGSEITLNHAAITELGFLLDNLGYLRPSRRRPRRGYARFKGNQRSVGYAGEKTANVLLDRANESGVFPYPPISRRVGQFDSTEQTCTLGDAVNAWLQHLHLAHDVTIQESQRYGTNYLDIRITLREGGGTRDITEVGFAISQSLPVIVGALLQAKDSLFIVDLPEAHLHPLPQSLTADLFCSLALAGRTAIVETHSELFFQRLRLRIAANPELARLISVYFVDAPRSDGMCSLPREVGLSFEDEIKWPAGFLTEALDTEFQIRSVRHQRTRHA